MAQDQYHHGVTVTETTDGSQSMQTVSTAIMGMVAWANDADNTVFPLDTPVLISDIRSAIGRAGTSGSLASALTAIGNQVSAPIVVVRVDDGTSGQTSGQSGESSGSGSGSSGSSSSGTSSSNSNIQQALIANIVGTTTSMGQKTGLQALLVAEPVVGVKPRILGVPYIADDGVTTALVTVAKSLKAFCYAAINASNVSGAIADRSNLGGRELMPIYGDFIGVDATGSGSTTVSAVAVAMGLRALTDQQVGWHRCISNIAVNSVTGVTKPISWDLQDTGTDADQLNQNDITALIHRSGYRFWGVRTCDTTGAFTFESYTRTAQVIADTIAEACLPDIDQPLTPMLASEIIDNINAKFRQWTGLGYLLGGQAWLDTQVNTANSLKGGELIINYKYTPVPPLENLSFTQEITDSYLANFAGQVTA
ncbi:putative prophage major tail sheath protein [Halomonadaceae bacterium LMG 33818]|uniref:phage tail sheath C-terminal domain-containing protein n=1 Tax=Cernens ardua TaxID=3402176 RepID=UPI003EDBF547